MTREELVALIAEKDAALKPLRSELAKLQAELRRLDMEAVGVRSGEQP